MTVETGFFDDQGPGGPVWFQHLMWFLGHPEVLLLGFLFICAIAGTILARKQVRQRLRLVPFLFLVSGALYATVGVVLGLSMMNSSVDQTLHDTYYLTAHYQFVLALSSIFVALAAVYMLFERLAQTPQGKAIAIAQWFSFSAAMCLISFPQYALSLQGMPRRYINHTEHAEAWQFVSVAGYFATLISALLFVICICEAIYRRKRNTEIHLNND